MKKTFLKEMLTMEHKTLFYVSFFIAFSMNANRLTPLVHPEIEVVFDIPLAFDLAEFMYQIVIGWLFCFLLGILLLNKLRVGIDDPPKVKLLKYVLTALFLAVSLLFSIYSQKFLFDNLMNSRIFLTNSVVRFLVSSGLIFVVVRVLKLAQKHRAKELENEILKSAYFKAQLQNLKAQVNPHFLFNSLSSLTGLIAENSDAAQKYVKNLAKIFRYSLAEHSSSLVGLEQEMEMFHAYVTLLKIRFEDNLKVTVSTEGMEHYKLPSMSLQPLLENVTKHNHISDKHPINVNLFIADDKIHFINGLTQPKYDTPSNGIGLLNLNERYKLLLDENIVIQKTDNEFRVQLPLLAK
ncbi:MAG: histidine kinase [Bacteroidota bacterium]